MMDIKKAEEKDLEEILKVQYVAFRREAEEFQDFNIESMTQTTDILKKEYQTDIFLKAVNDEGEIIGSIRGYIENGTSYIGKTFVHSDYQGKGIGIRLIRTLEKMNRHCDMRSMQA